MITLLIDCHYLGHQARYTHKGLKSKEGKPTGVLFGFLSRVLSLCFLFETNDVIFCWDSSKSIRKIRYDWYKKKPPLSPEDMNDLQEAREQFTILRKRILPAIGFKNNIMYPGREADDVIASIVQGCLGDFIIVAGDEDFYQLLYGCRVYHPVKNKMMTGKRLMDEYNCHVAEWRMVKQIAGCTSDRIPGVVGVGEKTAIKYLRNALKEDSKAFKSIKSSEGQAIIERNRWLVSLPLPETKTPSFESNHFDLDSFVEICTEFSFNSFMEEISFKEWEDLFAGDFKKEKTTVTVGHKKKGFDIC